MDIAANVAPLALVALFVLFVARWQPRPAKGPEVRPEMGEIPIVSPEGAPIARGTAERDEAMREALRASGRVPKKEWSRTALRLLFVPDDATDAELAELLSAVAGRAVTAEEIADSEGDVSSRVRFRAILDARGWSDLVTPLGTHLAPGPFDAYRRDAGSA